MIVLEHERKIEEQEKSLNIAEESHKKIHEWREQRIKLLVENDKIESEKRRKAMLEQVDISSLFPLIVNDWNRFEETNSTSKTVKKQSS